MKTINKITVIGGGSTYTPELVEGFITHKEDITLNELVLFDIDNERLNIVGGLVKRMIEHAGLSSQVVLTLDRPAAIEGANFIVSQIRVGGNKARIRDEEIPLKYNIIGQETTGPGGTLKAWRTIPVVLDIAHEVEKYAPNAWFVNFTNPSGIITETLLNHTQLNAVGLCNNPINFFARMSRLFNVPDKEIFLEWIGLNHVNWVRKVYIQGQDRTSEVIDQVAKDGVPNYSFDANLVRHLGVIPNNSYLKYYYFPEKKVEEAKLAEKTRGEVVLEIEKDLLTKYANLDLKIKPPELNLRGGALYSEAAIRLILSIALDKRDIQIVDTLNNGAILDLPYNASVEIPCVIGAHGVIPLQMGNLPKTIRNLCQSVKSWESWTVEAGVTGSRDAGLSAFMSNPLVPSYTVAHDLLEEMLDANREFLPQFFK
ncbi:MAG: 6-phospho-beta-glucosidase [Pelolinea sp.]|nr:6-phospho-beta-glucosidase [Pelolinea sp.]